MTRDYIYRLKTKNNNNNNFTVTEIPYITIYFVKTLLVLTLSS